MGNKTYLEKLAFRERQRQRESEILERKRALREKQRLEAKAKYYAKVQAKEEKPKAELTKEDIRRLIDAATDLGLI